MIVWLPLIGLIVGVLIGIYTTFVVPVAYATYLSIALLATLDSALGGMRGLLQGDFNKLLMISGFIGNTALALLLTYLGQRLGLDLYIAAVIVFCFRIFNNFGAIRRLLIVGKKKRKNVTPVKPESQARAASKKHPRMEDE